MMRPGYLVGHIRDALAASPEVGSLDLSVYVANDVVFLTGTVDCAAKREAVTQVAAAAAPGMVIQNDIRILTLAPADAAETFHDQSRSNR